ncbi:MAG: aminotransferase class I/II-fold pyridoxal phosphate-dependent enzyme [Myxococcales bacterium FL481]|nr:MAG: aminotransferase class I/II-fold pyridoxal phosphate-dependent enzyme [Myxococcales bacterium FL481]
MSHSVKSRVAPCEYIEWALSVPAGARFDLTKSGMPDAMTHEVAANWRDELDLATSCRRDAHAATRRAFVELVAARYEVDADRVVPTCGASLALTQSLMTLVRPGDHVVVERPTYEPLYRVPELLGAEVSRLERCADEGWAALPDRLARLLTPRTRVVLLSNLHNPTGVATAASALIEIGDMAARVGAMVLCDEVYLDYAFRSEAAQPAAVTIDNAISWSSTSKCFGFGALRIGWMIAPNPEVAGAIERMAAFLYMTVPNASLQLATAVLARSEEYTARARRVGESGRRIVERWLDAETRVRWTRPDAGLTGLVELPALMSDRELSHHLRERYDTQVVPGALFEAPGNVRLSYGLPDAALEQALANFSDALDDLS